MKGKSGANRSNTIPLPSSPPSCRKTNITTTTTHTTTVTTTTTAITTATSTATSTSRRRRSIRDTRTATRMGTHTHTVVRTWKVSPLPPPSPVHTAIFLPPYPLSLRLPPSPFFFLPLPHSNNHRCIPALARGHAGECGSDYLLLYHPDVGLDDRRSDLLSLHRRPHLPLHHPPHQAVIQDTSPGNPSSYHFILFIILFIFVFY